MYKKSISLCAVLLAACLILPGRSSIVSKQGGRTPSVESARSALITITFPESFEKTSGYDAKELVSYFKKNGNNQYESLSVKDGKVQMSATDKQIAYWKTFASDQANKQEGCLTALNSKYHAKCNKSHNEISVYYNSAITMTDAFSYIGKAGIFCTMYQIFDGVQEPTVNLNIYNSDTDKLVVSGNLKDNISYGDSDWAQSYQLTNEEADTLKTSHSAEYTYTINSTFGKSVDLIEVLQNAGGSYEYVYTDTSGDTVLGMTEQDKENTEKKLLQYLDSMKTQIEGEGDGYDLVWADDFSSVKYYFDNQMDTQDQVNYVTNAEIICMYSQILKNNSDQYHIDLTIFNSSTGEQIAAGNSESGITWDSGSN